MCLEWNFDYFIDYFMYNIGMEWVRFEDDFRDQIMGA